MQISESVLPDAFYQDRPTIRDSFHLVDAAGEVPTNPSKTSITVLVGISASKRVAILPASRQRFSSVGQMELPTVLFRYTERWYSTLPKRQVKVPVEGLVRYHDLPSRSIVQAPSSRFSTAFETGFRMYSRMIGFRNVLRQFRKLGQGITQYFRYLQPDCTLAKIIFSSMLAAVGTAPSPKSHDPAHFCHLETENERIKPKKSENTKFGLFHGKIYRNMENTPVSTYYPKP